MIWNLQLGHIASHRLRLTHVYPALTYGNLHALSYFLFDVANKATKIVRTVFEKLRHIYGQIIVDPGTIFPAYILFV